MERRIDWPSGEQLAETWALPLVEVHDAIASTQDRAFEIARSGALPWSVVIATEQTSGRGRRGTPWQSAAGLGLWASVILPSDLAGNLPLPLRLGLAAAETVAALLGDRGDAVMIKWPNDVFASGKKVAGVLAEQRGPHTVAGLGVNVLHSLRDFGEDVQSRATSLHLEGWDGELLHMARLLFDAVRACCEASDAEVLARIRTRDFLEGKPVADGEGRVGLGSGIDADGALRLTDDGQEWRVWAGSVTLLKPSTGRP